MLYTRPTTSGWISGILISIVITRLAVKDNLALEKGPKLGEGAGISFTLCEVPWCTCTTFVGQADAWWGDCDKVQSVFEDFWSVAKHVWIMISL